MTKLLPLLFVLCAPLWAFPARTRADNEPADLTVRYYGLVGGSLWGNAYYDLPVKPRNDELAHILDVRGGASLLLHPYFSVETAFGYSRWQTEFFKSYGRGKSTSLHFRAGPALRLPLTSGPAGEPRDSFFLSACAGPAVSFVSEDVPHVQVTENNSPRTGFVAAAGVGLDVFLKRRIGLRLEVDMDFMGVWYRSTLQGPTGPVGQHDFEHVFRRTIGLLGLWVQP